MQQANSSQGSSNLQGHETKTVTIGHTDFTFHEPDGWHAKRACRLYLKMIGCTVADLVPAMIAAEEAAGDEGEPDYGPALAPFIARAMLSDEADISPEIAGELLAILSGEPKDYWLTPGRFTLDDVNTLMMGAATLLPFASFQRGASAMLVGMVNSYMRGLTTSAPSSDSGADTPPTSSPGSESAGASGTPSA